MITYNRSNLKKLKKDITEQIKADVQICDLYIPHWVTYGDNVYIGNQTQMRFEGKITKRELPEYRVYKKGILLITVNVDEPEIDIDFAVNVIAIDEYGEVYDRWVRLNI